MLAVLLAAATALSAAPDVHTPGPLTLTTALQNQKLPQQTEADTFVRVQVTGEKVRNDKRLPLNMVLVIDRSGSMGGTGPKGTNKMSDARIAAKQMLSALGEADHFAVLSFDEGAELLASGPGIPAKIAEANARIDQLTARGGTDMVSGLRDGIAQASSAYSKDRTNRVILISDGVPNTEAGLVEMARAATGKGVQVTTLGVGTDYNETLMSKIADAGAGNYYFIDDSTALAGILKKELNEAMAVVGREVMLKLTFSSGVKPVQVYGYDARLDAEHAIVPLGDIFGGQVAEVLIKVHHPRLEGDRKVAAVELSYFDALAKTSKAADRELVASFIGDQKAIAESMDKDTAAKAEKIAAADAVNQAMDKLKEGKKEEAKQLLHAARQRNDAAQAQLGYKASRTGGDMLYSFDDQLNAPASEAAPAPVMVKKAKAAARELER